MTMCWLYGYIISSILRSIYEREGEREREREKRERDMASLNMSLCRLSTWSIIRHQQGNTKYYTTVSRNTASTASFLVVKLKGERLVTHRLAKPCRQPQKHLAAALASASKTWFQIIMHVDSQVNLLNLLSNIHKCPWSLFNHTSVTDDNTIVDGMILPRSVCDFPNPQNSCGNWACANSVYQALFPPPPQEPGNEARHDPEAFTRKKRKNISTSRTKQPMNTGLWYESAGAWMTLMHMHMQCIQKL